MTVPTVSCTHCGKNFTTDDLRGTHCRYCGTVLAHHARAAQQVAVVQQMMADRNGNGIPDAYEGLVQNAQANAFQGIVHGPPAGGFGTPMHNPYGMANPYAAAQANAMAQAGKAVATGLIIALVVGALVVLLVVGIAVFLFVAR